MLGHVLFLRHVTETSYMFYYLYITANNDFVDGGVLGWRTLRYVL